MDMFWTYIGLSLGVGGAIGAFLTERALNKRFRELLKVRESYAFRRGELAAWQEAVDMQKRSAG